MQAQARFSGSTPAVSGALQKIASFNVEGRRKGPELRDSDIALAALDESDHCPMQSRSMSKLFLREASLDSECPNARSESDQIVTIFRGSHGHSTLWLESVAIDYESVASALACETMIRPPWRL